MKKTKPSNSGDIDISAWHSVSHGDPDGALGQPNHRLQAYFAGEFRYFVEKAEKHFRRRGSRCSTTPQRFLHPERQQPGDGLRPNLGRNLTTRPNTHLLVVGGSAGGAGRPGACSTPAGAITTTFMSALLRAIGMDDDVCSAALNWCRGPLIALAGGRSRRGSGSAVPLRRVPNPLTEPRRRCGLEAAPFPLCQHPTSRPTTSADGHHRSAR